MDDMEKNIHELKYFKGKTSRRVKDGFKANVHKHDWASWYGWGGTGGGVSANGPSNEDRDKFLSSSRSSFPEEILHKSETALM